MKKLLFVVVVMSGFGIANGMLDNQVLQSHDGNESVELTHLRERMKQSRRYLLEQHCEYVINKLPMLSDLQQQQAVPMLKLTDWFLITPLSMNDYPLIEEAQSISHQIEEAQSILRQNQYYCLKEEKTSPFSETEEWLALIESRLNLAFVAKGFLPCTFKDDYSGHAAWYISNLKGSIAGDCESLLDWHCGYVKNRLPMLSDLQQQQAVPMLKLTQSNLTAILAAVSVNGSLQECCPLLEEAQSILNQEQYLHFGMEETLSLAGTEEWLGLIGVRCSLIEILNQVLHTIISTAP
jgi:uncharacterized protein YoaH (UPF0181 family)